MLLLLAQQFKAGCYDIIDNPADDKRSIRLGNPHDTNVQLYIYTYGQEQDRYGIHIEYPNLQETNYSDTLEIYENITFSHLVNIIITELGILPSHVNNSPFFSTSK